MRTQLLFSLFAVSLHASLTLAEHIPPQNILWGERGPAGATLLPVTKTSLKPDPIEERDSECTNSPTFRNCWFNGFSAATDFDKKWPTTNTKTVHYDLDITQSTCNPDGNKTIECMLINNQYPGPTIIADWGDTLSVTVNNKMQDNGTGIHWHGMRQLNSVGMDGVPGITECPLAPGKSKTYVFKLTQYGTTWYHSHYSAQYGMGVVGGLIINGPATSNYDIDLGTYLVQDWYTRTAYQVALESTRNLNVKPRGLAPPDGDNILVNGTNTNNLGGGKHNIVTLTKGKKYLLRLINPSVDNQIRVQLDGHKFTVVTADLVPIVPTTTDWLLLGIGQRYNVIIEANQEENSNHWFRAVAETGCRSGNANVNGTSAIFRYEGAPEVNPTSTGAPNPNNVNCTEHGPLVPYVPNDVPSTAFTTQAQTLPVNTDTFEGVTGNQQNIVLWGINLTAIDVDWEKPILSYVQQGDTNYPKTENLIELKTGVDWNYWIIQQATTAPPVPHPIHLHGHDFYLLGQGRGAFDNSSIPSLTFKNPTRRDVAFLPNAGWMVIAFPTDNPGAWLMHCHIAWHIGEGLGVQFLESKEKFPPYPPDYSQTCADWSDYYKNPRYKKNDSGLKKI